MLKNKLTLLPLLATSAAVMGENEQPNILFCIADDASRESFGAYGGRNCNTPAIDAL
ncbi:heparan N-sulfatase, partial [Bacteroides ovatus]